MKRRLLLPVVLILLASLAVIVIPRSSQAQGANPVPVRPNMVMFLLDDLSWSVLDQAVAATLPSGAPVLPNFKQYIYDKSIDFRQTFASNPVCCPSRATFYSGQYSHNHKTLSNGLRQGGVGFFQDGYDDDGDGNPDGDSVAYALQRSGYRTAHFGKYLNGYGFMLQFTKGAERDAAYNEYLSIVEEYKLKRTRVDMPGTGLTYQPPGWTQWNPSIDPTTYCAYNTVFSINGQPVLFHSSGQILNPENLPNPLPPPSNKNYQTHVIQSLAVSFLNIHGGSPDPLFMSIAPLAPHVENCDWSYLRLGGDIGPMLAGEPFPFLSNNALTGLGYRGQFIETIRPAPVDHTPWLNGHFENIAQAFLTGYPSFDEPEGGSMADKPWFTQLKAPPLTANYSNGYPYSFDEDLITTQPPEFHWDVQSQTPRNMAIRQFARMMASLIAVDRMIGAVAQKLSDQGRLSNTVFIVAGDNGYSHGQHRLNSKLLAYEDSARIPLLVSLPALTERQVSYALLLDNDLTPTLLDLARSPTSTPSMNIAVDGTSFKTLLQTPSAAWRRQALTEQFNTLWPGENRYGAIHPSSFAVRTSIHHPSMPNRKYVEYFNGLQYGVSKLWAPGFYLCPAENPDCQPARSWAYDADGANLIPNGPQGEPGGREYYNLTLDVYESNNGYWSGAPANIRATGAQDCGYLKTHLNQLANCSGIGCRLAEWAPAAQPTNPGACPN